MGECVITLEFDAQNAQKKLALGINVLGPIPLTKFGCR